MIQMQPVAPSPKTQRAAQPKATPSKADIVNGLADLINCLTYPGHTVTVDALFLKAEGDYTRAEIEKHLPAACDRAIEIARQKEAARRVA